MPEVETKTDIDDKETRCSETQFEKESREETDWTVSSFYRRSQPEIDAIREAIAPLVDAVRARTADLLALDLLDASAQPLGPLAETFTGPTGDELARLERQRAGQRLHDIALQRRKGRLISRVRGLALMLPVVLRLSAAAGTVVAVHEHVDALKNGRRPRRPGSGTRGTSELTEEQRQNVKEQIERWWALPDEQVWAHVADMCDRRAPSLQCQALLLSEIKALSAEPATPFEWASGDDKAAVVTSCVQAYDAFRPPSATPRSRALYEHIARYEYQGRPLPRTVAADVVELAVHQIIADTRPARMGPRLHFPERSDIAETRLYASRYLGQARRNGIRVYRHSATRLREALELRCGPIPLIDLDQAEEWIAGLPEDNRERLRAERNAVVAAWRRAFPLLPGERIIRDGMTALADPWQGNDAHTLVYSRRTDLGELAVVAQGTHIDLDTGDYVWTHPASRATSRPSLSAVEAFGVGGATVDMVEECISTFSTIMAACGPEGQVVGAVALVLNTILKVAFPETQVNLPTVIDQIVKQDLAQHNIEQDMTRLLAYTAWMKHQAQDAIANHYDYQQGQEYDETLQNIKDTIEHALDPSNPLLQSISDLQYGKYPCEPEFQIMALPVFLQGVSIHLLFLQTAILLSNNATTFKTSRTESLVNTAKDYLQHLQTQLDTISSRYEHRMACRTSQIYDFSYSECSGGMCTDEKVVYFIDLYGSEYPQRDTIEMHGWANIAGWERCGHAKGGGFDCPDMKPAQAEYFAQLDADFRTHYNFGAKRESDLREAMNMLQGIIDTYSPMVSA